MRTFLPLLLIGALTIHSCSKDEDEIAVPAQSSVWEEVSDHPQLGLYTEALLLAGLDTKLENQTVTAIAPSDSAILSFLAIYELDNLPQLKAELGDQSFSQLWQYSLVPASMQLSDFETSYLPSTAENSWNQNIYLFSERHQSSLTLNGVARIKDADHEAGNGYVHISNQVLTPATLLTLVRANPQLSTLSAVLDLPGIGTSVTLNQENGDFTFLAPTDQAFSEFLSSNAFAGVEGLESAYGLANLDLIMKYHLLIFTIKADQFSDEVYSTMYTPYTLQSSRTANELIFTDQQGREARLVLTNIGAVNGNLHSIDKVLLPF